MNYVLDAKDPNRESVRANLHAFIDRLPTTQSWQFAVTKYHKPRSEKQRKALFGAAYKPLMEYMGLRGERDKEDLHAFFCGEYWGWHPVLKNKPIRTTTRNEHGEREEISTVDALEFYGFIQQRAAEQGVMVPDPDPFWKEREAAWATHSGQVPKSVRCEGCTPQLRMQSWLSGMGDPPKP